MEQFSFEGFETPTDKEVQYISAFIDIMRDAVVRSGGPEDQLCVEPTKTYTAVKLGSFTIFRICFRGKSHYISVPVTFKDLIPADYPQKLLSSDPKYKRIYIDADHTPDSYIDFLTSLAGETLNRYPKEWSCCSRYLECSDAKKCVHPDKAFALSCGYRKNLNAGRVFYGANRNI